MHEHMIGKGRDSQARRASMLVCHCQEIFTQVLSVLPPSLLPPLPIEVEVVGARIRSP